jgi:hypothetical protein
MPVSIVPMVVAATVGAVPGPVAPTTTLVHADYVTIFGQQRPVTRRSASMICSLGPQYFTETGVAVGQVERCHPLHNGVLAP